MTDTLTLLLSIFVLIHVALVGIGFKVYSELVKWQVLGLTRKTRTTSKKSKKLGAR